MPNDYIVPIKLFVTNDIVSEIVGGIELYQEKYGKLPDKIRCGEVAYKLLCSNKENISYIKDRTISYTQKKTLEPLEINIDKARRFSDGISYGYLDSAVAGSFFTPSYAVDLYTRSSGDNIDYTINTTASSDFRTRYR